MYTANVIFGTKGKHKQNDLEDLVECYLRNLFHTGQLCGESFHTWTKGVLNAHVMLSGPSAISIKHHSKYGKESLRKVTETFGAEPTWRILDDTMPKRSPSWRGSPFLYLFTHAFDFLAPPIRRGDSGKRIPAYLLPIKYETRSDIFRWQDSYYHHDHVWFESGALEVAAYREMADPLSDLSTEGREICMEIEKATGIPTYYYLVRYWGRRVGEEKRKCPSCGGKWRTKNPIDHSAEFRKFAFQCKKCRLVSHVADDYEDERHAKIGEYRKNTKRKKR